eukprot:5321302-Pyramimonas_sp.AAC.1
MLFRTLATWKSVVLDSRNSSGQNGAQVLRPNMQSDSAMALAFATRTSVLASFMNTKSAMAPSISNM